MKDFLKTVYKSPQRNISYLKKTKVNEEVLDHRQICSYNLECDQGFGHTVGVSLRRTILSFTKGVAPVAIKINHAEHLFDSLKGVKSSVLDIVLKLQKIAFKFLYEDTDYCFLNLKKTAGSDGCIVYANDFEKNSNIVIMNGDFPICQLDNNGSLDIQIILASGIGYVASQDHVFQPFLQEGFLALDSFFSPEIHCGYTVTKITSGKNIFDRIALQISSNGSVTPDEILEQAGRNIFNVFSCFGKNIKEEQNEDDNFEKKDDMEELLNSKIETLDLSIRSKNCLLANNIIQLIHLVERTEAELQSLNGLGGKSLSEIKLFLLNNGLHLGKKITIKKRIL